MIKMKYADIMDMGFTQAFQKLASSPLYSKTAYNIKKMGDVINVERQKIKDAYLAATEPFMKKDAEGKVIRPNPDPASFEIDEAKQADYQAMEKAFGEKIVEIDRAPLPLTCFEDIKLTAYEVTKLEPILNLPDEGVSEGNVRSISAASAK